MFRARPVTLGPLQFAGAAEPLPAQASASEEPLLPISPLPSSPTCTIHYGLLARAAVLVAATALCIVYNNTPASAYLNKAFTNIGGAVLLSELAVWLLAIWWFAGEVDELWAFLSWNYYNSVATFEQRNPGKKVPIERIALQANPAYSRGTRGAVSLPESPRSPAHEAAHAAVPGTVDLATVLTGVSDLAARDSAVERGEGKATTSSR